MMKALIQTLLFCLMLTQLHAQCEQQDYLALRALYLSTDGDNWKSADSTNAWPNAAFFIANPTVPTGTDVSTWYGVGTDMGGCVTQLYLISNQLSGSIPPELGNLNNLIYLYLPSNQLSGNIPLELGSLSNLTSLGLWTNDLSGSIPSELGNLSNLTDLQLQKNDLSGSIPPELGNLGNLTLLSLFDNNLSGNIPSELGNLSNLTDLTLFSNQLIGSLPGELGNLSNLEKLVLYDNQLSGCYDANLMNLCNQLELSGINISNGNNFDATWDDFCATGNGICSPTDVEFPDDSNNDLPAYLINSLGETPRLVYELDKYGMVDISLYSINGQQLRTIHKASSDAGEYQIDIDKSNLPRGIYFIHIRHQSAGYIHTKTLKILI